MPVHTAQRNKNQTYKMGDVICEAGDRFDGLFILHHGKVGVFLPPPEEGESSAIRTFGKQVGEVESRDSILGLAGLFTDRRIASLYALSAETTLERVPVTPSGVARTICADPELGLSICRSLAERFADLPHQVRNRTGAVPSLLRAYDSLSLTYTQFVDKALEIRRRLGEEALPDLEASRRHVLYESGAACQHQRHHLQSIITSALAEHQARLLEIPEHAVLQYETDIGPALSLVLDGVLQIFVEQKRVASLTAGHFAGEVLVFLRRSPSQIALFKAATPVQLACIAPRDFAFLARKQPNLLVALAQMLARRLDAVYRIAADPEKGLAAELDRLAGPPASCAEAFGHLALALASEEKSVRRLREIALTLAEQARRTREDLNDSCNRILEICAGGLSPA